MLTICSKRLQEFINTANSFVFQGIILDENIHLEISFEVEA